MEHKISLLKRAGESAFPVKMEMGDGFRIEGMDMSLRDYFAAKAMQGILVNTERNEFSFGKVDEIASKAYELADAMLRAREK
ncbi:hypothetical protein ABM024_11465 [Morganella morganii]|uniref:hypothetical protein n=1 Tax=Morganella morganii TaxID=582 RepID=UPI003EBE94C4